MLGNHAGSSAAQTLSHMLAAGQCTVTVRGAPWRTGKSSETSAICTKPAFAASRARPLFGVREARGYHWLTYRDFAGRVDVLRAALLARGLQRGDRVALIAPNSPEWAVVAFATFTAGGALVPIYPYQRYDDWLDILRDASPRFVFAYGIEAASAVHGWRAELTRGALAGLYARSRHLRGRLARRVPRARFRRIAAGRHTRARRYLCSSSTPRARWAAPRACELSHRNIASNLSGLHQIFPVTPDDRSLAFLPWAHAFGQVVELYGLFSMGASLALSPSEDDIVKSLHRGAAHAAVQRAAPVQPPVRRRCRSASAARAPLPARLFEDGLDNARIRRRVRAAGKARGTVELKAKLYDKLVFQRIREQLGGRVRYAVCGGAQLAPEVAEFVDSIGITLYEGYGLTEASPIVSANWPGAQTARLRRQAAAPGARSDRPQRRAQ